MAYRSFRKISVAITVALIVLALINPLTALATEPHEDPEAADTVFSGIALFRNYSASLDFILKNAPEEVGARLEKMLFANIPPLLEQVTGDFASSGISLSYLVFSIDKDLSQLRTLMGQFRFDEAAQLAVVTSKNLTKAYRNLTEVEKALVVTGRELEVSLSPEGSELRGSYNEVTERIARIREMLDIYQQMLANLLLGTTQPEELAEVLEEAGFIEDMMGILDEQSISAYLSSIPPEKLLRPTEITLSAEPTVAFVGDNISFEGRLTSEDSPLAGREINILLNSSGYITAYTNTEGYFRGTLALPYWYQNEIDVQALYSPGAEDVGFYLASVSPVIKIQVLFYTAELGIKVETKAYPGLETTISGRFDYGQSPPPNERGIEIYLDDVLVVEAIAQQEFTRKIQLSPDIDLGKHTITVSAPALSRYSSTTTSVTLDVTEAVPVLDIELPRLLMIPGSVQLEGRLYSEVGPLSGASIKMKLAQSQVELVSSEDGTFSTEISIGMGLGLIGTRDLVTEVTPLEPWHAPLKTTSSVLMINIISCGGFLAIIVCLGIFLPRQLRRFRTYPARAEVTEREITALKPAVIYSRRLTQPISSDKISREPLHRILYWYHLVVRLLQRVTTALSGPQHTLRELAYQSSGVLGSAAKYFIELTRIVERLLYSEHKPTDEDADSSEQLSRNIEGVIKGEGL
ncbi:DUF4129 domain-containing protein [Chloroflexota bacterium]